MLCWAALLLIIIFWPTSAIVCPIISVRLCSINYQLNGKILSIILGGGERGRARTSRNLYGLSARTFYVGAALTRLTHLPITFSIDDDDFLAFTKSVEALVGQQQQPREFFGISNCLVTQRSLRIYEKVSEGLDKKLDRKKLGIGARLTRN